MVRVGGRVRGGDPQSPPPRGRRPTSPYPHTPSRNIDGRYSDEDDSDEEGFTHSANHVEEVALKVKSTVAGSNRALGYIKLGLSRSPADRQFADTSEALADSGCSSTLMRLDLAKKLKLEIEPNNKTELFNASNKPMNVAGWASLFVRADHLASPRMLRVIVSADISKSQEIMVGKNDLIKLNLLHPNWPNHLPSVHKANSAKEGGEEEGGEPGNSGQIPPAYTPAPMGLKHKSSRSKASTKSN